MTAWREQGVLDRPSLWVKRWRNEAFSGTNIVHKTGLGTKRTYQPGEMPLSTRPRPGLRIRLQAFHQKLGSEAALSSSQLKAAVPDNRTRAEEEVQTSRTMEDLTETRDELDRVLKKTFARTQEDRDMWKRLFEDCNKTQGEEIERLRKEYKEQSERLGAAKAERLLLAENVPREQSPMELQTPRGLSQLTEVKNSTRSNRVTIPNPSDNLGNQVVKTTMKQLVEAAGRHVANRNMPDFGVNALYRMIDDTQRSDERNKNWRCYDYGVKKKCLQFGSFSNRI